MQSLIDGSPRMREAGALAEGIEGVCGPLQCYGAREGVMQQMKIGLNTKVAPIAQNAENAVAAPPIAAAAAAAPVVAAPMANPPLPQRVAGPERVAQLAQAAAQNAQIAAMLANYQQNPQQEMADDLALLEMSARPS